MGDTFASDEDRALVARAAEDKKLWTWKVVVGSVDFSMEYRTKAYTIHEVVQRYPHALEIKRMKR